MKILKFLFLFFALLFVSESSQAQGWTYVNSSRGNFSFQLPSGSYTQKDTLTTLFYSYAVDSTLVLDTHFIENVSLIQNDSLFTVLLNQNNSDSLRAMAAFMLVVAKGQLVSIQNINATSINPKGIEIGISYVDDQTGNGLIFSRIFYKDGKFTAFTISGIVSDATRIGIYKTSFFNSISFAQP